MYAFKHVRRRPVIDDARLHKYLIQPIRMPSRAASKVRESPVRRQYCYISDKKGVPILNGRIVSEVSDMTPFSTASTLEQVLPVAKAALNNPRSTYVSC